MRKIFCKSLPAAALGLAIVATGARADTNLSTGINGGWTAEGASTSTVYSTSADWYGGWLANNASSSWIAKNPNSTSGNNLTYSLIFTVTSPLVSAIRNASWAIDDRGEIFLNNHSLSSLDAGAWGGMTALVIPSSYLIAGNNTLSIVAGATDNYLEGVRFEGVLTTPGPVIGAGLPSLMAGLSLLGLWGRRKLNAR